MSIFLEARFFSPQKSLADVHAIVSFARLGSINVAPTI